MLPCKDDSAAHFLRLPCTLLHRAEVRLTSEDIAVLQRYDWPGNVRELQYVIERAVILASGPHLHLDIPVAQGAPPAVGMQSAAQGAKAGAVPMEVVPYTALKRRERENMQAALEQTRWKVYGHDGVALLGMKPTALAFRMKALGIPTRTLGAHRLWSRVVDCGGKARHIEGGPIFWQAFGATTCRPGCENNTQHGPGGE